MEPQPPSSRLRQHGEEEQNLSREQQQTGKEKEFATAEELIRHDAQQTTPPAEIEQRLRASVAAEPTAKVSWWRRLLGQREA